MSKETINTFAQAVESLKEIKNSDIVFINGKSDALNVFDKIVAVAVFFESYDANLKAFAFDFKHKSESILSQNEDSAYACDNETQSIKDVVSEFACLISDYYSVNI